MADTHDLKEITKFAIEVVSKRLNIILKSKEVPVGSQGKVKKFDGASNDNDVVVNVINNSGYTSSGKLPSAKIRSTYADCYFLNLTNAKIKILAITNEEFFNIFNKNSKGLLEGIELMYIELPDNLKEIASNVAKIASMEMTK